MSFLRYCGQLLVGGLNNRLMNAYQNVQPLNFQQPSRSLIQYSMMRGKKKTVKTVVKRFFRLQWGAWIRTIGGRHKGLWKKSDARRKVLRNHIFCNSTQTRMFDKMVAKCWRKPKYFVDDIYEPYQKRDNFWITKRNQYYQLK